MASTLMGTQMNTLQSGSRRQNLLLMENKIKVLIILKCMLLCLSRTGKRKGGSTKMIHAAGFSGIAATIWAGGIKTIPVKSSDGKV